MFSRNLAKLGKNVTESGQFSSAAFEPSVVSAAPTQYDSEGLLPDSGLFAGQTGFVTSSNGYYVSDGTTWYQIDFDTTNASPSINSVIFGAGWNISDSVYYFDSDLSKTYTITINATDSDNLPLSFSLDSNTTFNQYATATFDRNIATILLNDSSRDAIVTDLQVKARDAFDSDALVLPSIKFTRVRDPIWSLTSQSAKLVASDPELNAYFGYEVDISNNTIVIGSFLKPEGGSQRGVAYVFDYDGSSWTETQKIKPASHSDFDYFGQDVAISGDRIIIGATYEDTAGSNTGSAYIFEKESGVWVEKATLTSSTAQTNDLFGTTVALDGTTALVGALWDKSPSDFSDGAVYVYEGSGVSWTQQARLFPAAGNPAEVGRGLAIQGDVAFVGAPRDDTTANDAGGVYIFTRSGSTWTEQSLLLSDDIAADDRFGQSIAISGDTLIVGCIEGRNDSSVRTGAAYIFTGSGSSWTQQAKLTPSDGQAGDLFGIYVAINGDVAVVSATSHDSPFSNSGAVYIFTRSGTTWTQQAKIQSTDIASADNFGSGVAISNTHVVVGAYLNDDGFSAAGSAYVFVPG